MQELRCEICGNNELIKEDGVFRCNECGMKYTLEEARKLLVSNNVSSTPRPEPAESGQEAPEITQVSLTPKTKPKSKKKPSVPELDPANFKIRGGVLVKYKGKAFDVVIPDGVTSIEHSAFYGCEHLTSVTIPDGVKGTGYEAFMYCTSLDPTKVKTPVFTQQVFEGTGFEAKGYCAGKL